MTPRQCPNHTPASNLSQPILWWDHPVPFRPAPAVTLRLLCASSVLRRAILSAPAPRQPLMMANPSFANVTKVTSYPSKGSPTFAEAGTSGAQALQPVGTIARTNESTFVPSVAKNRTMLSPGPEEKRLKFLDHTRNFILAFQAQHCYSCGMDSRSMHT